MIVYDIECSNGHVFEGWFESSEAFEEQRKKKLISCPYCNDTNVRRVLSPVAIKHSRSEEKEEKREEKKEEFDYTKLYYKIVDFIKKNTEDVGPDFAKEALKMHYGLTKKRNIRGVATEEEEKMLREEGIDFFKFPMPKEDEKDKH